MTSPTARTLKYFRDVGQHAAVVERYNQFSKRRVDLFNFIDLVVIGVKHGGILAVQATSDSNHASRKTKILAEPKALAWLESGARIWVMSWAKKGPRGKLKKWEYRITEITADMFPDTFLESPEFKK